MGSPQPLGTGGDLRRRLLLHHLPLALASGVAFVLWMTLPPFQGAGHQGPPPGVQHAAEAAGHDGPPQAAGPHGPPRAGGHQVPGEPGSDPSIDRAGHETRSPDELQGRVLMARATTATGYIALALLALTLLIGPANLLLDRRNPVSNYLRRDVGAWTAGVSVVHVIVGLQVHGPAASLGERILHYFLEPDGSLLTNSFGLGNWTGLAGTVIVVGLLAISSDFALSKLKAGSWKWLQRLNYGLFALVVAHAIFYGALLRITSPSTLLLGLSVIVVFVAQAVGIWLWRRSALAQHTSAP